MAVVVVRVKVVSGGSRDFGRGCDGTGVGSGGNGGNSDGGGDGGIGGCG